MSWTLPAFDEERLASRGSKCGIVDLQQLREARSLVGSIEKPETPKRLAPPRPLRSLRPGLPPPCLAAVGYSPPRWT